MNYPLETSVMEALQKFTQRLNQEPPMESIEPTPDRKAQTVVISHVEMTLDELFFGQWSTMNFTWSAIANEVQGSLELRCIHPVSGQVITRTGAASIVITVDKVPDEIKDDARLRNEWALSASNKKPNALDLAFPKLKAECLKNAALSLGKIFGRDLNRKVKDQFKGFKFNTSTTGLKELPKAAMNQIESAILNGGDEFEIRQQIEIVKEIMSEEQQQSIDKLFKEREA